MALHDELLELAQRHLEFTPGEAILRRAVSTAYYALFHRLIHEATNAIFSDPGDAALRVATGRSFEHTAMKNLCQQISQGKLTPQVAAHLDIAKMPNDLKELARNFLTLQEARHAADYDQGYEPTPSDAQALIKHGIDAFTNLDNLRGHPTLKVFLVSLLLAKTWKI